MGRFTPTSAPYAELSTRVGDDNYPRWLGRAHVKWFFTGYWDNVRGLPYLDQDDNQLPHESL